jgi:ASC-1-like (ASCH) protein
MNHLVFLDTRAGELEKILSGIKSMVVKVFDPAAHPVKPGDSLYFLRDNDECALRVEATVVRVLSFTNSTEEDLSHTLKEQQPRLQLTEAQYNTWSVKKQVQLVELDCAHKIDMIHVAAHKISSRSGWIAFEQFNLIIE